MKDLNSALIAAKKIMNSPVISSITPQKGQMGLMESIAKESHQGTVISPDILDTSSFDNSNENIDINLDAPMDDNKQASNINNLKNSKLPKEIIASFSQEPIDTSSLYEGLSSSPELDKLTEKLSKKYPQAKNENFVKSNKSIISETRASNAGIDYSVLRAIINDCIKENINNIKNELLVEKNNKLEFIRIGEKFNFIDSSGKIYEATLSPTGRRIKTKK